MKVYEITSENEGSPLIIGSMKQLEDNVGTIGDWEIGEAMTIKVIEMSQEDFDNLPEWDGW